MKTNSHKRAIFTLRPLVAALALTVVPGIVMAEPLLQVPFTNNADMSRYETNYIELGGLYNNKDSASFGEWSGIADKSGYAIGNLNWGARNDETARHWNVWGSNLGLDSRQMGAILGVQGLYKVTAGFNQISHFSTDSASFIHRNAGEDTLTLPSGFPGINGQPPANSDAILSSLQQYDIRQSRDTFKLGGSMFLGEKIEFLGNYRYDKRDGSNIVGGVMGNSGGNPRAVILPYALDDNTQQIEGKVRWASEKAQVEALYYYSRYSNDRDSLSWQNPYNTISGWQPNTGFSNGYGRMAMMPDNDYHQFQLTGGYDFTSHTRFTGTASYGISQQNDSFQPYTINTQYLNVNTALPNDSLHGKIENTLLDLNLMTRPIDKLNVKVNYKYNDYSNKTASNLYSYVGGDTTDQTAVPAGSNPETINSSRLRYNSTPGSTENAFKVDASYPLMAGTILRGYYNYKKTDYTPSEEELRGHTEANIFGAELRKRANAFVTGALKYEYTQRRGGDFDQNRPYAAGYTNATVAAGYFDNLPTTRQFTMADYDQNKVKASLNLTPADALSFSLEADWYQRDYQGPNCGGRADQVLQPGYTIDGTCMGLQKAVGQSYTLDGQWTPINGISTYAFYTWSQRNTDQNGRSYSNKGPLASDPTRNWGNTLDDTDDTIGIGARFVPSDRRYDLGVQYLWVMGRTATSIWAGSSLVAPTAVPDVKYRLNSAQLYGSYQWSKNVKLRVNYIYEQAKSDDWAYDEANAASSNNVVTTGQLATHYTNWLVGLAVAYTY